MIRGIGGALFGFLLLGGHPGRGVAQDTEILRGRVTDSAGRAIEGATIIITGLTTQMSRTITTNRMGTFTSLFTSPEGQYLVMARSLGFAPKSVQLLRTGVSAVLVADFKLDILPFQLDSILAVARPFPRLIGDAINAMDIDLLASALLSIDPADIMALIATVPGVRAVPDSGFSVLGVGPDQNNITIDGATTRNTQLPRDAIGSATVSLTPFDGSLGRFSGGQVSVTTKGGTDLFLANVRSNGSDQFLVWRDPGSTATFPRLFSLSGSVSGPIRVGKAHYLGSFDIQNRASAYNSLLTLTAPQLALSGIPRDTLLALATTMGTLGIPAWKSAIPPDLIQNKSASFFRIDYAPTGTFSTKLQLSLSRTLKGGTGISPASFPSIGTDGLDRGASLQFKASGYLGGLVDELTSTLEQNTSRSTPYFSIPAATVRVGTIFDDGRTGLTTLKIGGGTSGERLTDARSWETTNEISLITKDNVHRFKAGQNIRFDRNQSSQSTNRFGSYSYRSIADLAAGTPTSYSRTLTVRDLATRGRSGAIWLGDDYRRSKDLQFQASLRLDMVKAGTVPPYNHLVDSLFDRRTDFVPHDVGLAPRLGFTWTLPPAAATALAKPNTAVRKKRPVVFSGGVGVFRGVISASRIVGMIDQTGLPTTTRTLNCATEAAPPPDWGGATPLPDECVDGTAPKDYAVSKPNVSIFDPGYKSPLAWRGSLSIAGMEYGGMNISVNSTYSLGYFNESQINLNMPTTPYFTLAGADQRPMYVPVAGVVPKTGTIAPGAGRLYPDFQKVNNLLSDLSSRAAQVTINVSPQEDLFGSVPLTFAYTWQYGTAEERGFQGTTGGDPFLKEWAPGRQATHQIAMTARFKIWWFQLTSRFNMKSGLPYTPMIASDINGDGASNDRAFIPDPRHVTDPVFAEEFSTLIASAPSSARDCLERQLGRIAARNSCHLGWEFTSDLGFEFVPPKSVGFGDRLRMTITMQNANNGLLRILGLSDSKLGLASATAPPNSKLLYVTRFDPETKQYAYRVNQLFGNREDASQKNSGGSPFQLTMGMEYRLGGPPVAPIAKSLGLFPLDRGPALTRSQVQERIRALSTDPVEVLLALDKKLGLDADQRDRLGVVRQTFQAKTDSIFAPLTDYVLNSGRKVSDAEVKKFLNGGQKPMQAALLETSRKAVAILRPEQQALLPGVVNGAKKP